MSMTTPGGAGGGDAPPSSSRSGPAPNGSQNQAGDSIILEEEIDPNYEPTEDEVIEYAKWLGMDLAADKDLWWIAREGLKAPLPENWKPCKTTDTEEIYYFNFATGASTWDHPCDEYYRNLYEEEKKKRGSRHQTKEKKEQMERERSDVKKILGKDKKQRRKKRKSEKLANPLKTGAKLNDIRGKPLGGALSRKPLGSIAKKKPLGGGGGAAERDRDRGRDRDRNRDRNRDHRDRDHRDRDRDRDRARDRGRHSRSKGETEHRSRSRSKDRDRPTSSRSRAASRLSSALSDPEGGDRRSRDSSRESRDRRSRSPLMQNKDQDKDFDENLSRRRNEMADELRDLESTHERKLRRMESEHAAEVRSQERKHEDDLRDKRSAWDDDIREAKARADREVREAREKAREEARAEVERERARELDRAKDELDRAKDKSREEKERVERDLREELRALRQEHEDKVADLKREQERAAERLERDSLDELDRKRRAIEAKHADSLEDLKRDHRSEKDRAEREFREEMDAARERERTSAIESERKKDALRDSQERELEALREEHRQRMRDEEKELAENARREKERAQERARREVEKGQRQELEELKEKGRTTLRQSREAHVEEMQKLTSRQNEEEHRMRKRLEEIRKRSSDAVEMAEAEARATRSSTESKSGGGGGDSSGSAAQIVSLQKDVRGLEDRLRAAGDTNDGLRRSLEQAESRCARAEENMRETERDRKKAVNEAKDARKNEEENARARKVAEEKLDGLERDLARERRRAQEAEEEVKKTALAVAEHSSEASMATAAAKRHEEALFILRRTHKSELRDLREKLEAKTGDEVRAARDEERARAARASGEASNEKHSAEVNKLRGDIDEERQKKEKVADDLRAARKEAEEASEAQAALQRQVDSLQASLDAQGKGAMGRVEQMKVFRKQVSDLEEDVRKAKADLEAAEEGKMRADRRCEDETRDLQRKLTDAGREKVDLETRSKVAEVTITELRGTLREAREAARKQASEQASAIHALEARLNASSSSSSSSSSSAATTITTQDVARAVQQRELELKEEYNNNLSVALEAQRKDFDMEKSKLQAAPSSPNPFSISPAELSAEKKKSAALREELDRAKSKSQRLQADLAAATDAFATAQQNEDGGNNNGQNGKLITTVTELRREKNDLVDRAEECEARAKIAEGEVSTAFAKVKALRASLLELEGENRRAKAECEEANDTLAAEKRKHREDASLSSRRQANLKREAEDLARQLEESKILASTLATEVDEAKKSARDMMEAAGASGGNDSSKMNLLHDVAQQRLRIASLESREQALTLQLEESSESLAKAKSEARQMRMDIARQKKTIQKYEAGFGKRGQDEPASGNAPQKMSETKTAGSSASQPSEGALAWQQKARKERELLGRAKKYVDSQKKEVKRRQRRIERDRKDWREDMRQYQRATENHDPSSRSRSRRQMLREIKKSLEHDAHELNEAVAHLRSMEQWLKNRERKVVKLEAAAFNFNNPGANLDESSFNVAAEGLDMSDLAGWEHSSGSAGDEGELERLSDELDDDFSSLNMSMSGMEDSGRGNMQNAGGANPMMWARIMAGMMQQQQQTRRQPRRRTHHQNQNRRNRGADRGGHSFWNDENNMYAAAAAAAAAAAMQQQQHHHHQVYYPSRNNWFQKHPKQYAGENVDINMEREWMGRGRPPADRVNSADGSAMSNPENDHRRDVFQRQIQRWAGRQQTARDAMSKHANWLRKFGQEIQGARVNEANIFGGGEKAKAAKIKEVKRGLAANVLSPNVKRAARLDSKEEVGVEDL